MWVERVQECEGRIATLQQQINEMAISGNFVVGEGEDVTRRFFDCQEDMCSVNRQINQLLEAVNNVPDDQWEVNTVNDVKRFLTGLAQFTDQLCRDLSQMRDEREQRNRQMQQLAAAEVVRVIEFEYDEREEQRLSEAPGYNEFSSSDEDSD